MGSEAAGFGDSFQDLADKPLALDYIEQMRKWGSGRVQIFEDARRGLDAEQWDEFLRCVRKLWPEFEIPG